MYKELDNFLRAVDANRKITLSATRDLQNIDDVSFSEIFHTAISYLNKSEEKGINISKTQDLAIKEIEENLFMMPSNAKEAYINRVLYRLFKNNKYLFDVADVGSEGFMIRQLIELSNSMPPDISNEDFDDVLYDLNEAMSFVLLTRRFLTELLELIKTFGLDYNKNEYPLEKLLKLNREEDNLYKQMDKVPRLFAREMSKLDDATIQREKRAEISIKIFEDYLHHKNIDELLPVLHSLLNGKKGKDVAIVLLALKELGIIYIGNRNELYRAMREEFGDIGSPAGINDYLNKEVSIRNDIDTAKLIIENI